MCFCSTIIPTVGRLTLSRAVNSVLNQTFAADNFEIIVVNDSGQPLPVADWQRSKKVQIISTNRHNRSVARNTGAAIANGRYLHFLDDDDWLLPDALQHFWELANSSQAGWLYGAFRMVDNAGRTIAEVFPEEVGNCFIQLLSFEWLPIQASLVESKAFFSVGGFATVQPFSRVFQDIDLSRQIARYYQIARTDHIVASIRTGDVGSTTNYADMFIANRQSREKALNMPGTFSRLSASARVSRPRASYWHGKVVYYYLASIRWQLKHKRVSTAVSRSVYALVGFAAAGRHILSMDFWYGALKPHLSRVWVAFEESGASLYVNTRWR